MKEKKENPEIYLMGSMLRMAQEGTLSDPLGSYTGVPLDRFETPVQDADDL